MKRIYKVTVASDYTFRMRMDTAQANVRID
jgi:hypothetical protein